MRLPDVPIENSQPKTEDTEAEAASANVDSVVAGTAAETAAETAVVDSPAHANTTQSSEVAAAS
jgi:hypothetical protein